MPHTGTAPSQSRTVEPLMPQSNGESTSSVNKKSNTTHGESLPAVLQISDDHLELVDNRLQTALVVNGDSSLMNGASETSSCDSGLCLLPGIVTGNGLPPAWTSAKNASAVIPLTL